MSADPIKAALAEAVNVHTVDAWTLEDERRAFLTQNMAAAIAAFLRALPTCSIRFEQHGGYGQKVLAAAVERAAREGGG